MTHLSVVIPTYNRPELLKRSIRSVLQQTETIDVPVEIVVVDDGSSTPPDRDAFLGHDIRYLDLDRNSGPQVARNKGLGIAKGDWVLMLDDDDELIDGTLASVLRKIERIKDYKDYPVYFFATTKGHISGEFAFIHTIDILKGKLKGDFTPVIQRSVFLEKGYHYHDYPELLGVGCESLTWLDISRSFPIPTFNHTLVKVNEDAPLRLSSYENFIRNSNKFALQQDITIRFLQEYSLDQMCPAFLDKKRLGAATYYLISGKRDVCRERLKSVRSLTLEKVLVRILSYFPVSWAKFLFRRYKLRFSK